MISYEMKQFIIKYFSNAQDFDKLCRECKIVNVFRGNFPDMITSLILKLERSYSNEIEIFDRAIEELKPALYPNWRRAMKGLP